MATSLITGLHFDDMKKLLAMLQKLVNSGNTVVVEHNLDVIKSADWIIDLGPEGDAISYRALPLARPCSTVRIIAAPQRLVLAWLREVYRSTAKG